MFSYINCQEICTAESTVRFILLEKSSAIRPHFLYNDHIYISSFEQKIDT